MKNDPFVAFADALLTELRAADVQHEVAIVRGVCPDDGGLHLELHLFDVPRGIRRDVETAMIRRLIALEDRLTPVGALAFVHASGLDADAVAAIKASALRRMAPRPPIWTVPSPAVIETEVRFLKAESKWTSKEGRTAPNLACAA